MTAADLERALSEACRVLYPTAPLMEMRAPALAHYMHNLLVPQQRLPL